MHPHLFMSTVGTGLLLGFLLNPLAAQDLKVQKSDLTFLATFDKGAEADFSMGEKSFYRAQTVARKKLEMGKPVEGVVPYKNSGRFGSAIDFTRKTEAVLCYRAAQNFPYSPQPFDATISFWMKCDRAKLPDGFIDPLQITDKKWNDASIFVDFDNQRPASFRLGVFSDLKFWNPDNRDFNKMKPEERPMIDAGRATFTKDKWTHVGLVFKGINSEATSSCQMYLDGKRVGELKRKQKFSWNPEQAYIMLGIYFVGQLDDFAIFKTALRKDQVQSIVNSGVSIGSLLNQ